MGNTIDNDIHWLSFKFKPCQTIFQLNEGQVKARNEDKKKKLVPVKPGFCFCDCLVQLFDHYVPTPILARPQ